MGKERSKKFREGLRESTKVNLKGKNGIRKMSEIEILASLYSEEEIERGKRRIDEKIKKRDRKSIKKGESLIPESVGQDREYEYQRKVPGNTIGITKEQFYDSDYPGYKQKIMISAYPKDGKPRYIVVETRGDYTNEEKAKLVREDDIDR